MDKEEYIITYFIKDKEQQTLKEFEENGSLDTALVMYAKIKKNAPLTTLWKRLDTGGFYHWFRFNNEH